MDIKAVVDHMAQFGLIKPHRVTGDYYTCTCPIHSDGNEKKPSFGILLVDQYRAGQHYPAGFCHCFACGIACTLPELVSKILKNKNLDSDGLKWLQLNIPEFEYQETSKEYLLSESLTSAITSKFAIQDLQKRTAPPVEYISEEELAKYRFTVPYMYERHLTDESIAKYDIGYDAEFVPPGRKNPLPCITFPVRDNKGRTLFFCRRAISTKFFNYPMGVTKPVYGLYELPSGCKSVVIAESCINCITITQFGYPCVALLGTSNSYQLSQLKSLGVDEFVLCLDGDEAGRRAAQKIKKALQSVAIVWTMNMPDGKDANDIDKETFDKLYQERE